MQINSTGRKILVLGDVHQDITRVENIVKAEQPDLTLCVGDWFDSLDYNEEHHVERTAQYIKKHIYNMDFITLMGNHDVAYLYDNALTLCSGYTKRKNNLIDEIFGNFKPAIRDRFHWYLWLDDYLLTHAGLHHYHLPAYASIDKEPLSKWLDYQVDQCKTALIGQSSHWMFRAGAARGGRQVYGGTLWLDWRKEYEPIVGLKQIVGHTRNYRIDTKEHNPDRSNVAAGNICIDCELAEYLIVNSGKITIKRYMDL